MNASVWVSDEEESAFSDPGGHEFMFRLNRDATIVRDCHSLQEAMEMPLHVAGWLVAGSFSFALDLRDEARVLDVDPIPITAGVGFAETISHTPPVAFGSAI